MGYDLERIFEAVDEELKCGICFGLLENPVQINDCEHIFCGNCIKEWLSKQLNCPIDRKSVLHSQIKAAPKLITNFIAKVTITCNFAKNGCHSIVKVDQIYEHIKSCEFNPKNMIRCANGCETLLISSQLSQHICPKNYSLAVMEGQQKQIALLESRLKLMEREYFKMRKELNFLKNMIGLEDKESDNAMPMRGKLIVKIDDKTLVIDADPREPISTIKQKVQQMENISAEELLVFFSNKELDENKTLSDYRIYKLQNPLFLFMVKKKIRVLIRIDREKQYPLELSPKDIVGDVLAKIVKKEGLASKEMVLSFRNKEMDESRTLFSYKIRDNNFVFLNTRREIQERKAALSQSII
jgi:hypothetical protein